MRSSRAALMARLASAGLILAMPVTACAWGDEGHEIIALIADHYGRHFITAMRHPGQYWQWLVMLALIVAAAAALVIYLHGRLSAAAPTGAVAQS